MIWKFYLLFCLLQIFGPECVLLPFRRIRAAAHIKTQKSHGCVEMITPRVIVILLTQQQSKTPDPSLTQIQPLSGQANPSNLHGRL